MHTFSCNQVKSTSEITWGACGAVATLQKSSSDDRDMVCDVALALQEFRRCAAYCAPAPHCRISLSAKQGRVRTTSDDAGGQSEQSVGGAVLGSSSSNQHRRGRRVSQMSVKN